MFSLFWCCVPGSGITPEQIYSTASHQQGDLTGINFRNNDLAGVDFAGQNLTGSYFAGTNLAGANFTGADVRGAYFDPYYYDGVSGRVVASISSAITANLIGPSGVIDGLTLNAGGLLVVRDYDGGIPVTVNQQLAMDPGGTLRIVLDVSDWDSTISFAPGIPVALGGTLELIFADEVNLASQVGRTFDLIDWTGVIPIGAFTVSSPYRWNLSNLYTTGEVTLTAVPEPSAIALAACAVGLAILRRGRCLHKD
jgi:uncharacterized protein YjbI with pentapeptide repeats